MFGLVLDLLAKVVEHHDVGVHVEEVVGVGRVVFRGPHLRLRAAVREHMVAVLRLVVHAVEASHLVDREDFFLCYFFLISVCCFVVCTQEDVEFVGYVRILGRRVRLCAVVD